MPRPTGSEPIRHLRTMTRQTVNDVETSRAKLPAIDGTLETTRTLCSLVAARTTVRMVTDGRGVEETEEWLAMTGV